MKDFRRSAACGCFLAVIVLCAGCAGQAPQAREKLPSSELLEKHCALIGEPRVVKVSEHVWAAVGYDLANEILINTPAGNVIVDPLMSPARGMAAKRDLLAAAPAGKVLAVIYTHSHIDHIGGASLWMADKPQIWATGSFEEHLYKQYQVFLPIETIRGRRQFGDHATLEDLPCNGIGRRTDIKAAREGMGIRLPTHTFTGKKSLSFGGFEIVMIEAKGETHDQLMVWLPGERTVVAADDFYWTYPNLYTIRGTSPRPVDEWIRSIDRMRSLKPAHLVPCHTVPVEGEAEINSVLTNYRDAIQWVRDEVVRWANKGADIDTIAENIKLPPHLAGLHYTEEFYGQVDWSAKGIYTSSLGWFDGRPDKLYPMKAREAAAREVTLMGGPGRVLEMADEAFRSGDFRWAVHLLAKLGDSNLAKGPREGELKEKQARAYEGLASTLHNLNGRGYLLEAAYELRNGIEKPIQPKLDEGLVEGVPLEAIFTIMASRIIPEKAADVHACVSFEFTDIHTRYFITVRKGLAEVAEGEPLPGTPEPVATVVTDSSTWKRVAAKLASPVSAVASGKMKVKGSWIGFLSWKGCFDLD